MEGAIRHGNQSLALYRAAEAEQEASLIQNNLANAYLEMGNLARAKQLAAVALRENEREGTGREMATVLDTQARIQLAGGKVSTAVDLARRAMDAALTTENRKALADATVTLARASMQAGRPEQAIGMYQDAARLLREHGSRPRLAEVMGEWADIVANLGDHETAFHLTREALHGMTSGSSA
jgi:tetratricopeptide (TPR) repeat protein